MKLRYAAFDINQSHQFLKHIIDHATDWQPFRQWADWTEEHDRPVLAGLMRKAADQYEQKAVIDKIMIPGATMEGHQSKDWTYYPGVYDHNTLHIVHPHPDGDDDWHRSWKIRFKDFQERNYYMSKLQQEGVQPLQRPREYTHPNDYSRRRYAAFDRTQSLSFLHKLLKHPTRTDWGPFNEWADWMEEHDKPFLADLMRKVVWSKGSKHHNWPSGHSVQVEKSRTGALGGHNAGWSYYIDPENNNGVYLVHPEEDDYHRSWFVPLTQKDWVKLPKAMHNEGIHLLGHHDGSAMLRKLDPFTRQYAETALWSSTYNRMDEDGEGEDVPLDHEFDIHHIHPRTLRDMMTECKDFQEAHEKLLYPEGETGERASQGGHDFWLTRNGHGAGFWDRPEIWGHVNSRTLSEAARRYGDSSLYVGDEGRIHTHDESQDPVLHYHEPKSEGPIKNERQQAPAGGMVVREGTKSPIPGKTYGGGIYMPGGRFLPQVGARKRPRIMRHDGLFGPQRKQRRYAAFDPHQSYQFLDHALKADTMKPVLDWADWCEEHDKPTVAELLRKHVEQNPEKPNNAGNYTGINSFGVHQTSIADDNPSEAFDGFGFQYVHPSLIRLCHHRIESTHKKNKYGWFPIKFDVQIPQGSAMGYIQRLRDEGNVELDDSRPQYYTGVKRQMQRRRYAAFDPHTSRKLATEVATSGNHPDKMNMFADWLEEHNHPAVAEVMRRHWDKDPHEGLFSDSIRDRKTTGQHTNHNNNNGFVFTHTSWRNERMNGTRYVIRLNHPIDIKPVYPDKIPQASWWFGTEDGELYHRLIGELRNEGVGEFHNSTGQLLPKKMQRRRYAAYNHDQSMAFVKAGTVHQNPAKHMLDWADWVEEHDHPTVAALMRNFANRMLEHVNDKDTNPTQQNVLNRNLFRGRMIQNMKEPNSFGFHLYKLSGEHWISLSHPAADGGPRILMQVPFKSQEEASHFVQALHNEGVPQWRHPESGKLDFDSPRGETHKRIWHYPESSKPMQRRYAAATDSSHHLVQQILRSGSWESFGHLINHLKQAGKPAAAEVMQSHMMNHMRKRLPMDFGGPQGYPGHWGGIGHPDGFSFQHNHNPTEDEGHIKLRHIVPGTVDQTRHWIFHGNHAATSAMADRLKAEGIQEYDNKGWMAHEAPATGGNIHHIEADEATRRLGQPRPMQRQYAKQGLRMLPFQGGLMEKANREPGLEDQHHDATPPIKAATPKGMFAGTAFERGPGDGIVHKMVAGGTVSPHAIAERVTLNKVLNGLHVPINHPEFGREAATRWVEAASHVMHTSPHDPVVTDYLKAAADPARMDLQTGEVTPLERAARQLFQKTVRRHHWLNIYNLMAYNQVKTEAGRQAKAEKTQVLEPDEFYHPEIKPADDLPPIKPALAKGELGRKPGGRSRINLIDDQLAKGASREQIIHDLQTKFLLTPKQASDAYRRALVRRAAKKLSRILRSRPIPEAIKYYRPGGSLLKMCGMRSVG